MLCLTKTDDSNGLKHDLCSLAELFSIQQFQLMFKSQFSNEYLSFSKCFIVIINTPGNPYYEFIEPYVSTSYLLLHTWYFLIWRKEQVTKIQCNRLSQEAFTSFAPYTHSEETEIYLDSSWVIFLKLLFVDWLDDWISMLSPAHLYQAVLVPLI